MSKYYKPWFGYVRKMIERYPDKLQEDGSVQSMIALGAIKRAMDETLKMRDGEDRIKVISMLYLKKTHNINGVAYVLNISPRTAQRWKIDFINKVANKMGF